MLYICTISMMLSVLCDCGTEGPGAYVHLSVLSVKNSSTHDIEIIVEKPSSVLMTGTFTIKSGATFKTMTDAEGGFFNPNPLVAQIKFGDGIMMIHRYEDGDAYHNFCSEAAFEKKVQGKGCAEYTFEFTDEDYEYAKKHADKTE